MTDLIRQDGNTELWRTVFADGHPVLVAKQKRYRMLPSDPRCKLCELPFGGVGGWLLRQRGLKSSERNPHYCTSCDGFLEAFPGGAEVPMSMMMVDIRDSVGLSGQLSPTDFARLVMALRDDMVRILDKTDGFLLEFQGDSVFAVWPPGFVGPGHAVLALKAADMARQMFASRKGRDAAPVGVAVHTGPVYIGTVAGAGGRLQGISAFGLEVNILARLAAAARPGEVLVSAGAYGAANMPMPVGHQRSETLKGVDHPVEVAVL